MQGHTTLSESQRNVLSAPGTDRALTWNETHVTDSEGHQYPILKNVPMMVPNQDHRFEDFEKKYVSSEEPWSYSERAVELVRHHYVKEKVSELVEPGARVLDVGCSLGQLTALLDGVASEVWGVDLSPTAVMKAAQSVQGKKGTQFCWAVADATKLPFRSESFQIVLLSDGLVGWELSPSLQLDVLNEVNRILRPGGYAILTDYLNPKHFQSHKDHVQSGPLKLIETDYLGDRIGFQLATNLKAVSHVWPFKSLVQSLSFNRWLSQFSQKLGPSYSKHMSLVLQKSDS